MKAWIKAETEEELKRLSKVNDLCSAMFEFQEWLINNDHEVKETWFKILESKGVDLEDIYT